MNPDQFTKLIESIASLVQALGWPLLVLFIILYFGAPLKKFLNDVGEFTFKAGASGVEATAKRQQLEAAASLSAAIAQRGGDPSESMRSAPKDQAREIANLVSQATKPGDIQRLSEASVLWVDDNPSNNIYERTALEAFGIRFTLSLSTEDALARLRAYKYDVVISDMGRPPDAQAGYTLLAAKQSLGDTTPFIIYAGSDAPEHKAEALKRGAIGSTNHPKELFQLVVGAIQTGGK